MIISASYRTDIPAFFGPWFMNRLEAGGVAVRNPINRRISELSLKPEMVDGFVFWTKNLSPFSASLDELAQRGFPFVVQYSILGYPRWLERGVPGIELHSALMQRLRCSFGPRAAVWRYDPIVMSDATDADWHAANFAQVAARLAGTTDEVVISFAQIYRKTRRNLTEAARLAGQGWWNPPDDEKRALAARLQSIAADFGMDLTVCAQASLVPENAALARCIDARRLSDRAGRPIPAPERGNRPDCRCADSRDIGAYDTCPHGCAYCYAVARPEIVRARYRNHDPNAAGL